MSDDSWLQSVHYFCISCKDAQWRRHLNSARGNTEMALSTGVKYLEFMNDIYRSGTKNQSVDEEAKNRGNRWKAPAMKVMQSVDAEAGRKPRNGRH